MTNNSSSGSGTGRPTAGTPHAVRACACGSLIVGLGFVEATAASGPVLCRGCADAHGRERPGDVVPAIPEAPGVPVVDFDDCARQVAAALTTAGVDPDGDVHTAVVRAVAWLDGHNGIGGPELTMRIMKVGEEFGEVVTAWIGLAGQNPRKGVTHTGDDVADELADVVLAALVAVHSLGYDPALVLGRRARTVLTRINTDPAADRIGADR